MAETVSLRGSTILIADDDPGIRTVLSRALGLLDCDIRTTGTAATLWRWVSEGLGDLVITDVVLPDACVGRSKDNALDCLRNGDIVAVGSVVTDAVPRFVGRSRNTPATNRNVRVAECRLPMDFSGSAH